MEKRTTLYGDGDFDGIDALEQELLTRNAEYRHWECDDAMMATTNVSAETDEAIYLHCLPADISGVSCAAGEVAASVFERYRVPLYRQAGYSPT